MEKSVIELSKNRICKAEENLQASITMFEKEFYNFSINRSYYAVFDAIRAINALDNFDSSKHSGVISYFNQNYVKTEIFNSNTSKIIKKASLLREKSDYEDFYCATKQEAKECIKEATNFVNEVKNYISNRFGK